MARAWVVLVALLSASAPSRATAEPGLDSISPCSLVGDFADCSRRGLPTVPCCLPTNVTSLDLSHNGLVSISADWLSNFPDLRTLDLSFNSLSSLPGALFDRNTALTTLKLNNNNLTALPAGLFASLTLRSISLANNPLLLDIFSLGLRSQALNLTLLNLTGIRLFSCCGLEWLRASTFTTPRTSPVCSAPPFAAGLPLTGIIDPSICCPAGSYRNATLHQCIVCPAGTAAVGDTPSSCTRCLNSYSLANSISCTSYTQCGSREDFYVRHAPTPSSDRVCGRYDVAPVFAQQTYSVTLAKSANVGTSVLHVHATKVTNNISVLLTYSIVRSAAAFLSLNNATGLLSLNRPIVANEQQFTLTIKATDNRTSCFVYGQYARMPGGCSAQATIIVSIAAFLNCPAQQRRYVKNGAKAMPVTWTSPMLNDVGHTIELMSKIKVHNSSFSGFLFPLGSTLVSYEFGPFENNQTLRCAFKVLVSVGALLRAVGVGSRTTLHSNFNYIFTTVAGFGGGTFPSVAVMADLWFDTLAFEFASSTGNAYQVLQQFQPLRSVLSMLIITASSVPLGLATTRHAFVHPVNVSIEFANLSPSATVVPILLSGSVNGEGDAVYINSTDAALLDNPPALNNVFGFSSVIITIRSVCSMQPAPVACQARVRSAREMMFSPHTSNFLALVLRNQNFASFSTGSSPFVFLHDTTPPQLEGCPFDQSVLLPEGENFALLSWTEPFYSDNVGIASTLGPFGSIHSGFNVSMAVSPRMGPVTLTYQIWDPNFNQDNCSFTLRVGFTHRTLFVDENLTTAITLTRSDSPARRRRRRSWQGSFDTVIIPSAGQQQAPQQQPNTAAHVQHRVLTRLQPREMIFSTRLRRATRHRDASEDARDGGGVGNHKSVNDDGRDDDTRSELGAGPSDDAGDDQGAKSNEDSITSNDDTSSNIVNNDSEKENSNSQQNTVSNDDFQQPSHDDDNDDYNDDSDGSDGNDDNARHALYTHRHRRHPLPSRRSLESDSSDDLPLHIVENSLDLSAVNLNLHLNASYNEIAITFHSPPGLRMVIPPVPVGMPPVLLRVMLEFNSSACTSFQPSSATPTPSFADPLGDEYMWARFEGLRDLSGHPLEIANNRWLTTDASTVVSHFSNESNYVLLSGSGPTFTQGFSFSAITIGLAFPLGRNFTRDQSSTFASLHLSHSRLAFTFFLPFTAGNRIIDHLMAVTDVEPPMWLECPADINIVANHDPHQDGAQQAWWTEPWVVDNIGVAETNRSAAPGDLFPISQEGTVVTYLAMDSSDISAVCEFRVRVIDDTAPLIAYVGDTTLDFSSPTTAFPLVLGFIPDLVLENSVTLMLTLNISIDARTSTTTGSGSTTTTLYEVNLLGIKQLNTINNSIWVWSVASIHMGSPNTNNATGTTHAPLVSGAVLLQPGLYRIAALVADRSGNNHTAVKNVAVVDRQPPEFVACLERVALIVSAPLGGHVNVSWPPPSAIDNDRVVSIKTFDAQGILLLQPSLDIDLTARQLTTVALFFVATDASGNIATCNVTKVISNINDLNQTIALGTSTEADYAPKYIPVLTGSIAGVVCLAAVLVFLVWRRHKNLQRPANFAEYLARLNDVMNLPENRSGPRKPREMKREHIKIISNLGSGQFGTVDKALVDERRPGMPGYLCAVKQLVSTSSLETDNLLEESAILAQLESDFCVRLVGVVTVGRPLMMVVEYCEHGALNKYLQHNAGNISDKLMWTIAGDCCAGLAYLATTGFIHRDVAARNVLIASDMHAKISDFGMSREAADDSDYYQSRGGAMPVRWCAPEVLEQRKFSSRSDVWAAGVLFYEIWTEGETPYKGLSNQQVWVQVTGGYRLPKPKTCPDDTYEQMMLCWKDDPHQRPSAQALATFFREGKRRLFGEEEEQAGSTGVSDAESVPSQSSSRRRGTTKSLPSFSVQQSGGSLGPRTHFSQREATLPPHRMSLPQLPAIQNPALRRTSSAAPDRAMHRAAQDWKSSAESVAGPAVLSEVVVVSASSDSDAVEQAAGPVTATSPESSTPSTSISPAAALEMRGSGRRASSLVVGGSPVAEGGSEGETPATATTSVLSAVDSALLDDWSLGSGREQRNMQYEHSGDSVHSAGVPALIRRGTASPVSPTATYYYAERIVEEAETLEDPGRNMKQRRPSRIITASTAESFGMGSVGSESRRLQLLPGDYYAESSYDEGSATAASRARASRSPGDNAGQDDGPTQSDVPLLLQRQGSERSSYYAESGPEEESGVFVAGAASHAMPRARVLRSSSHRAAAVTQESAVSVASRASAADCASSGIGVGGIGQQSNYEYSDSELGSGGGVRISAAVVASVKAHGRVALNKDRREGRLTADLADDSGKQSSGAKGWLGPRESIV